MADLLQTETSKNTVSHFQCFGTWWWWQWWWCINACVSEWVWKSTAQNSDVCLIRLANSGFGHSGTPSPPLPSRPSSPSFSTPLPPSRSPWAPPLNPLGSLGERYKLPSGSGAKPQPTNDLVHASEPKGAALVATVFVHFHNNKFKFLYKH